MTLSKLKSSGDSLSTCTLTNSVSSQLIIVRGLIHAKREIRDGKFSGFRVAMIRAIAQPRDVRERLITDKTGAVTVGGR